MVALTACLLVCQTAALKVDTMVLNWAVEKVELSAETRVAKMDAMMADY